MTLRYVLCPYYNINMYIIFLILQIFEIQIICLCVYQYNNIFSVVPTGTSLFRAVAAVETCIFNFTITRSYQKNKYLSEMIYCRILKGE